MNMVIGGAYQGKQAYAKQCHPGFRWSDGASCDLEEIFSCQGMVHFEEWIKRRMQEKKEVSPKRLAEQILEKNPDLVIVTTELGYGLVPVDPFERAYREAVGRICTELAVCADRVDRVVCGIGIRIK